MEKIIIGVTGEIACGKGTVAKYIVEKYGADSYRFSTMLRDVLKRLHIDESRDTMQRLSTILRQTFGEDILAKVMSSDAEESKSNIIVVEGIRRLADIKYLQALPHFKLFYVEVDMQKRYERIIKRGENQDDNTKTFEEFQKDHERETELQIKDLKQHADFVVENGGTLEELHYQIDKIMAECQNGR
jgi:dephospho-CoA kinase